MNFEEILKDIANGVEGALSAILMGFDGIAVASYVKEKTQLEIEPLAVEYTRIISEVVRTANTVNVGGVREISISTSNFFMIFYVLPGNYFVALLLKDSANLGKGRYFLRRSAPELIAQL